MPTFQGPKPKFLVPDLESLQELVYCINCVEQVSGMIGTFGYDETMYEMTGSMWAVTPVFDAVDLFYDWARSKGFTHHSYEKSFTISRDSQPDV